MKLRVHILLFATSFMLPVAALVGQEATSIDDIYDQMESKNDNDSYVYLRSYVEEKGKHPVAYYQLGLITSRRMMAMDPLTQFDDITTLHDEASRVYFPLAINFMKESNISGYTVFLDSVRNRANPKKLTLSEFVYDVSKRKQAIDEYFSRVSGMYGDFSAAVSYYNRCIDIYKHINEYETFIKNLYFVPHDSLKAQFTLLEQCFDSSMYHFNKYKQSLAKFPLGGYNQKLVMKDINVYHLDGISNSDFMKPEVQVWNYKKWVTQFMSVLNSDIIAIRNNLGIFNQSYASALNLYTSTGNPSAVGNLQLPISMRYLIMKFDYNSLSLKLVDYMLSKKELLLELDQNKQIASARTSGLTDQELLYIFNKNYTKFEVCDSLLSIVVSSFRSADVGKFPEFFSPYFHDSSSLRHFQQSERSFCDNELTSTLAFYHKRTTQQLARDFLKQIKNQTFAFDEDSTGDQSLYCTYANRNHLSITACGYTHTKRTRTVFWVTYDTTGKQLMMKKLQPATAKATLYTTATLGINNYLVSNLGKQDSGITIHHFAGTIEKNKRHVGGNRYEAGCFDELFNNILVATADSSREDLHILTSLTNSLKKSWMKEVYIDGDLVYVIPDAASFLCVLEHESSVIAVRIDNTGAVTNQKTINLPSAPLTATASVNGDNSYSVSGTLTGGGVYFFKINKQLSETGFVVGSLRNK